MRDKIVGTVTEYCGKRYQAEFWQIYKVHLKVVQVQNIIFSSLGLEMSEVDPWSERS